MSSTFGRPLRVLLSSSSSLLHPSPRLSAAPARIYSISNASSRLTLSSRRQFAALPPSSSSGPAIALPPPPSPPPTPSPLPPSQDSSTPRNLQDEILHSTLSPPSIQSDQTLFQTPPKSTSSSSPPSPPRPSTPSSPPTSPSPPTPPPPPPTPTPPTPADPPGPSFQDRLSSISSQTSSSIRQAATETSQQIWTKADVLATRAVARFSMMGAKLNEVTGYDRIEVLKRNVTERETSIANLRSSFQTAKQSYLASVSLRSSSQREVNDLLQRKNSWRTEDVERFTVLVREDHENSRIEERSKAEMEGAEGKVESAFTELMNAILNRYHEEQLWSDKLRSFSTYVSVSVMVANLLVFITAIVFVEPYKRKRLAQTFEERVTEMTAQVEIRIEAGVGRVLLALEKRDGERDGEGLVGRLKRVASGGAGATTGSTTTLPAVAEDSVPSSLPSTSPPPPSSPPTPKPYHPLLPTLSSLTLPTLSSHTPKHLIEGAKDVADRSKEFVEKGWEGEGRERDLMVVAGGSVVLGGGLVWALFR